jgi:hypothetical protein
MSIVDQIINRLKDNEQAMVDWENFVLACAEYVTEVVKGADEKEANIRLHQAYQKLMPYNIKIAHGRTLEESAGIIVYDIFKNRRQ